MLRRVHVPHVSVDVYSADMGGDALRAEGVTRSIERYIPGLSRLRPSPRMLGNILVVYVPDTIERVVLHVHDVHVF